VHGSLCQLVPGLTIVPDFIQPEQERRLLELLCCDSLRFDVLAKRNVAHFGYAFDYANNSVDKAENQARPIPPEAMDVRGRLSALLPLTSPLMLRLDLRANVRRGAAAVRRRPDDGDGV
jgi:hypothetical protein